MEWADIYDRLLVDRNDEAAREALWNRVLGWARRALWQRGCYAIEDRLPGHRPSSGMRPPGSSTGSELISAAEPARRCNTNGPR
jgi:hypothetical protein